MDHDKEAIQPRITRTAPKPLTAVAIAGMRSGQTLGDGAVRPGAGTLKARKRPTSGGAVVEWLFEFQRDGKTARMTLGRYGATAANGYLTLSQARERAAELQRMVRAGQSPLDARELEREQARVQQASALEVVREAQSRTLAALVDGYVEALRNEGRERHAYDCKNIFDNHVARPFGSIAALPAGAVTPEHVVQILSRLVGPDVQEPAGRTALKLRAALRAAYSRALDAAMNPMAPASARGFKLSGNPAAAVPVRTLAQKFNRAGDRVLSADELREYVAHVIAVPSARVRIALLAQLALGGQRFRQLLRLDCKNVTDAALVLFDGKGRRAEPRRHELPLLPEVRELLRELAELNGQRLGADDGLLFSTPQATGAGSEVNRVPVDGQTLSTYIADICSAMLAQGAARTPFKGADIRRTCETQLAELGVSRDDRAQLLSHGLSGVQAKHYDRSDYLPAKRRVLRLWSDWLCDLCIGPAKNGTVLAFKRMA